VSVEPPLLRRALAELVGTASLVAVVVGSGAMAQSLSPDDTGLQLLQNAVSTGAGLFVLIAVFAPISGAQFNPVVTLVDAGSRRRSPLDVGVYLGAQLLGAVAGAVMANAMFGLALVGPSVNDRTGHELLLAEVVATTGLVTVIFGLVRAGRAALVAPAVGAYIMAAYYFTSSTSFANPAVTVGRAFTDSFSGIEPTDVLPFVGAQVVGALVGFLLVRVLWPAEQVLEAETVVMEETA
jgi:arsenate reductase